MRTRTRSVRDAYVAFVVLCSALWSEPHSLLCPALYIIINCYIVWTAWIELHHRTFGIFCKETVESRTLQIHVSDMSLACARTMFRNLWFCSGWSSWTLNNWCAVAQVFDQVWRWGMTIWTFFCLVLNRRNRNYLLLMGYFVERNVEFQLN